MAGWCKKGGPMPCKLCEEEEKVPYCTKCNTVPCDCNLNHGKVKDMGRHFCLRCDTYHEGGHVCKDKLDEGLKKFWMVVCFEHTGDYGKTVGTGNGPRVKHHTKESAEKEAKKLAKGNTTQHFVVLEAMDAFVIPSPKPQRIKLGDWTDEE